MKTTPSACDQCKFIGWDVGVVTQKGDTKREPASAPPPQKNSISQLELEAIHWSEAHLKRTQDCNDDDCDCGGDDDIDWEAVTDKNGNPVTRTIPISTTWEETVQGPSGPVTYKYTASGTVVIQKKRGTSECFPSKIVGRASRLYMPEFNVVVMSEGDASVSPEVGSAAIGALLRGASKPTKRRSPRRPKG